MFERILPGLVMGGLLAAFVLLGWLASHTAIVWGLV